MCHVRNISFLFVAFFVVFGCYRVCTCYIFTYEILRYYIYIYIYIFIIVQLVPPSSKLKNEGHYWPWTRITTEKRNPFDDAKDGMHLFSWGSFNKAAKKKYCHLHEGFEFVLMMMFVLIHVPGHFFKRSLAFGVPHICIYIYKYIYIYS